MMDRREAGSVRRGLGLLDEDLEGVRGVGDLLLGLLRAGVEDSCRGGAQVTAMPRPHMVAMRASATPP
jgi:hypothetical protein